MFAGESQTYFIRGVRTAKNVFGKINPNDEDYDWQWEHYTLGDYCTALTDAGFLIESFVEPEPDLSLRTIFPEMYERLSNRPIFILIRAIKVLP